jgi:hypothetical protein
MEQVTIQKIKGVAKKLDNASKKWHFHILSPGCIYNQKVKFALVLENVSDDEQYVAYTVERPSKVGKRLVEMLHGKVVSKSRRKPSKRSIKKLSNDVQNMVVRMKQLNEAGVSWHHHMLFPDCLFNTNRGKWTIIFEDPEKREVQEYSSKKEPKAALKVIEPLFYAQK